MSSKNESAILNIMDFEDKDICLDELETSLETELKEDFEELDFLNEEKNHINNPDYLGNIVLNTIWEQFLNQVSVTAGEDFIKENNNLTLDLRDSSHIQTAENFAEGKIAKHNSISREQLESNYDRFENVSHTIFRKEYVNRGMDKTLKRAGELNRQGIETVTDIYTGKQIPTKTKFENGKSNPLAAQREHVKSSDELYKNASLQMANGSEELANIINNPENLQGYTTAERNNRKSNKSADMMSDSDKTKDWKDANEKAENFIEKKEVEGEERLIQEGKKTQKEEAFRIGGKTLRTALMAILSALLKEVIGKLVLWLKSKERSLDTLLEHIKIAIRSFVGKLKDLLVSTTDSVITTIVTSIFGPIVSTIKKVFMLLKQGWKSLKEAIQYLRKPENKGKPLNQLLPQVGIIVISGLSGISAIILGELIEKGLIAALPALGIDIPILGSPANLIGMLMGAIVSGVVGAIAINLINSYVAKQQRNNNLEAQIDKKNEILQTQDRLMKIKLQKMENKKANSLQSIRETHNRAKEMISESLEIIFYENEDDEDNSELLSATANDLADLLF